MNYESLRRMKNLFKLFKTVGIFFYAIREYYVDYITS